MQVQLAADDYVGWIDVKQHTASITGILCRLVRRQDHPRALDVVQAVSDATTKIPLTLGCRLPFFDGMNVRMGDKSYFYNGTATNPTAPADTAPAGCPAAQNRPHVPEGALRVGRQKHLRPRLLRPGASSSTA